jgi:HEAT repeat protein
MAAGCTAQDSREIDKLFRQTQDLHSRLVFIEEQSQELNQRLERLHSLYNDLSVRHKGLQLEISLLRTRSQPFSTLEEKEKNEERVVSIVKRLGTEEESEWTGMKEELIAMGHVVVPFLLQAYKSQGPKAMARSRQVLLRIRDPRALAPFLVGLEHPQTRRIVAEALGQLGVVKAAKDLGRFLLDEKADVRLIVAEAMGNLGDLSGVPVLIKRLEHPTDTSRLLAITTLRRLTRQNFEFEPDATEDERKTPIELWKKWWRANKGKLELAFDVEEARKDREFPAGNGED